MDYNLIRKDIKSILNLDSNWNIDIYTCDSDCFQMSFWNSNDEEKYESVVCLTFFNPMYTERITGKKQKKFEMDISRFGSDIRTVKTPNNKKNSKIDNIILSYSLLQNIMNHYSEVQDYLVQKLNFTLS